MKAGADVLGIAIRADNGRRIGTVHDVLFDDACSRVVGLVVRSGLVFRTRQVVGFTEVQDISPRAVVVAGAKPRRPSPDEVAAMSTDRRSIQGRAVVTRGGEHLGTVRDVLFDEESGRVLGFEVLYANGRGRSHGRSRMWSVSASIAADKVVVFDVEQPQPVIGTTIPS